MTPNVFLNTAQCASLIAPYIAAGIRRNPEKLARLHGPIGLYIGSRMPAEIAISILVEMTAYKNGVALPDEVRVEVAKEASRLQMPATCPT